MTRCTKCHRRLKNPSPTGMGPKCAQALLGTKPKPSRRSAAKADEATADLFAEVPQ